MSLILRVCEQRMFFLITFLLASVKCDLKDYTDSDAYLLSQHWNRSLLEPPKNLYDQFTEELRAIRAMFPEVSSIRMDRSVSADDYTLGQLICHNIDLQKLNDNQELGPIKVEGVGYRIDGLQRVLITFSKAFNPSVLRNIVTDSYRRFWASETHGCEGVNRWGLRNRIRRSQALKASPTDPEWPINYLFTEGSGNCFRPDVSFCENKTIWMFEIDAQLMATTGEVKVKQINDSPRNIAFHEIVNSCLAQVYLLTLIAWTFYF